MCTFLGHKHSNRTKITVKVSSEVMSQMVEKNDANIFFS